MLFRLFGFLLFFLLLCVRFVKPTMEDCLVVESNDSHLLLLLLDGHGGATAAQIASSVLPDCVRARLDVDASPRVALEVK